jgi:putative ABC transport system permease protein
MKHSNAGPPRLFLRFFRWYCHPKMQDYIEGDLMEVYGTRLKAFGKREADIRFVIDVLLLFRPGIIRPAEGYRNLNNYGMFKSYFKIGWRNLLKNKGYSFINIGGLAVGMTVAILIGLWIQDELSFNKYHENYNALGKVLRHNTRHGETGTNSDQTAGLGTLLRSSYSSNFKAIVMATEAAEHVISSEDKKFTQLGNYIQPEGPEMFTLKMLSGTRGGLSDKNSILLSKSLSEKLFGTIDPLNKVVTIDSEHEVKVTGVYEDLPLNSEFREATFFAPLDLLISTNQWLSYHAWDNYFLMIYIQLLPGSDFHKSSEIIKDAMLKHVDEETLKTKPELFLHPMSQWHLNSSFENGLPVTSSAKMSVWYYGIIGGFVLLLACINFMNLSTARSERRAKEVGIRKSIGSIRSQLINQFFSESLLVAFLSFVLSLLIVQFSIPWFNAVADKNISIPVGMYQFWVAALVFTIFTGLLAGAYPALYLSSFNPVKVLKGTFKTGRWSSLPRRILVVAQFTISISIIIGTMIVYEQIQFGKDRPVGYSREGLLMLPMRSPEYESKYEQLRNELKKAGMVGEVAQSGRSVLENLGSNSGFDWDGKDDSFDPSFNTFWVSAEYGRTIGWEFLKGRDFATEIQSDRSGIVINESAQKLMGLQDPVGQSVTWVDWQKVNRGSFKILGVVKDMVKRSPYEPTDPSIAFLSEENAMGWLYIRLNPATKASEALPQIQSIFSKIIPSDPFDYKFADDAYNAKFRGEERVARLASVFSLLAILISCSGLFGLASFVAEQRTREISIRKVLGASLADVWRLLSREFVVLVMISCAIAIPLSFYFMSSWLQHYQYRITMTWFVFAVAGIGSLVITLLTISYQAIKTALINPVNSLKSE